MLRALAIALLATIGMLVFGFKPMAEICKAVGLPSLAVWKVLTVAVLVGILAFLAVI